LPASGHLSTDHSCPLQAHYCKVNSATHQMGVTTDEETPVLNMTAAGDASDDPIDISNV
jgi:hypothetical protein